MSMKRAADPESVLYNPKRHKPVRHDVTSGQRTMFGDLENATTVPLGDSDLECEDDAEALQYLKSVRSQAATIPHVLSATRSSRPVYVESDDDDGPGHTDHDIYENGMGDFRGYYQDGAYTAYPEGHWEDDDEEEGVQAEYARRDSRGGDDSESDRPYNSSADEIRNAYFESIVNRYLSLRGLLQTDPPHSALDALPSSNPTEAQDATEWEEHVQKTDPYPAQVAAMHKDNVLRLLHAIIDAHFLRKGRGLAERTSRWLWALLARLPAQGELNYTEIGCIRELGKRAVLMMVTLAEFGVLKEQYDVAGSSPDERRGTSYEVNIDENYENYDQEESSATHGSPVVTDDDGVCDSIKVSLTAGPEPASIPHGVGQEEDRDGSDVQMQLDSDAEDGEVDDTTPPPSSTSSSADPLADIEAAKARLLAQLGDDGDSAGAAETLGDFSGESRGAEQVIKEEGAEGPEEVDVSSKTLERSQVNERATLNMILTVAGEFYGQRDLLEFRDPFGGLHFE